MRAASNDNSIIAFIHIEKACGTTLHHVFRNQWPVSYAYLAPRRRWKHINRGLWSAAEAARFIERFPYIKAVGGHSLAPHIDYESSTGRTFNYITFIREPISRYTSHFKYQRDVMGIERTPQDFLNDNQFDNCMTRRIAGEDNAAKAIEIIESKKIVVGLLEDFDRSLVFMSQKLSLPDSFFHYEVRNKSGEKEAVNIFNTDAVLQRNEQDQELYRYVRDVIYPKQIASYKGDINQALIKFTTDNNNYQFSSIKRYVSAAVKRLLYEPFQKWDSRIVEAEL